MFFWILKAKYTGSFVKLSGIPFPKQEMGRTHRIYSIAQFAQISSLPYCVNRLFHVRNNFVWSREIAYCLHSFFVFVDSGKALEELRSSLFNEFRSSEGAKRQRQCRCGPIVALTFNFVVAVGIIFTNKLVCISHLSLYLIYPFNAILDFVVTASQLVSYFAFFFFFFLFSGA